jgi:hypothetical protein
MELPINIKELQTIIEAVKHINPQLHSKLWAYKINRNKGEKKEWTS